MPIDFKNEIYYDLHKFRYLIRKNTLNQQELEEMILLIHHVQELLEYYLYEVYEDFSDELYDYINY